MLVDLRDPGRITLSWGDVKMILTPGGIDLCCNGGKKRSLSWHKLDQFKKILDKRRQKWNANPLRM